MRVKEVMKKDIFFLQEESLVPDAIKTLHSHNLSGMPVVDKNGKLVGIFTEKSILKAIVPSYVVQVGHFVYEDTPKTMMRKVAKLSELKVCDLMLKDCFSVNEETTISEVAHKMLVQTTRRIPVVDSKHKLLGLVMRADVLKKLIQL